MRPWSIGPPADAETGSFAIANSAEPQVIAHRQCRGMDDLPDELVREIREHIAPPRAEWEMWLGDREERRLWSVLRGGRTMSQQEGREAVTFPGLLRGTLHDSVEHPAGFEWRDVWHSH